MEGPSTVGLIVIGILIRFGLPLAVTILVIWFFRRLDARWQAEAEQQLKAQATLAMVERIPCWDQRHCPPERRASCPAYAQKEVPCWQVHRDKIGRLQEACLGCDVFLKAPIPATALGH